MAPEIAVAVVTGLLSGISSITAVIITTKAGNKDISHKLETHQAVTDTKIETLTSEVRAHNNFAQRIPVIEEQIKTHDRRIDALERRAP